MSLWNRKEKSGGVMDQIRCDESSYLIWKWHPVGTGSGAGHRENAIRWGSSLRVREGEVAAFVYSNYDRANQEYLEGPCDMILNTSNLPVLAGLMGLAYDGGTPFQAEVYFINLAQIIQVRFGVPFFDVYDPRYPDFGVPVAVRGTVSFRIADYRKFIRLHGLREFKPEEFQLQIRDSVSRYVKDYVANAPAAHNIPVIQIESKIAQINDAVEYDLKERLQEDFGVSVSGVDIGAIELDKSNDGYRQLMAVTQTAVAAKIQAETQDYAERLRIQREEGRYAAHKQTQTANLGAFQIEKQAEVGIAGAEALGKMGEACDGAVHTGSDHFNMGAMMTSIAVGGAVGTNLAGMMNNAMVGLNRQVPSGPSGCAAPPVPQETYYVAVGGQPTGPFDLAMLTQMASLGQLTPKSLVWKQGMCDWLPAGQAEGLKSLFIQIPPVPVSENK